MSGSSASLGAGEPVDPVPCETEKSGLTRVGEKRLVGVGGIGTGIDTGMEPEGIGTGMAPGEARA